MKAAIIAAAVLTIGVGLWWITNEPQPSSDLTSGPASRPLATEPTPTQRHEPETTDVTEATGDTDQELVLDPDRLFDKSYELDPSIQAIAKKAGVSPACIIASAKQYFHQVPVEDGVCLKPDVAASDQSPGVAANHPYTEYNDAELRSLAVSDADAAVILARRIESHDEARQFYERAAALSGVADPLIEWMTVRDTGGLQYENGELNLELAKKGYEIFLTAADFDGTKDPIVELYQRELRNNGIDLRSIEREAAERAAYLREQRQELTGGERP